MALSIKDPETEALAPGLTGAPDRAERSADQGLERSRTYFTTS
jgi:hypothetical protein